MQPAFGPQTDDVTATSPTVVVKIAASVQAVTGLFTALVGIQLAVAFDFDDAPLLRLIPYGQVVLGLAAIVVGAMTYRARAGVAVANAALAGALALTNAVWLVVSVVWGIFSCMALMAALASVVSAIFGIAAIGPSRRASAARERLAREGIDLGL